MKLFSNLEVLYERSETNKRENGSSFNIYWDQIQPAKAQTDSDDESGISILSHQSKISISSHQTKTENATTQQTKGGIVSFEVSTNMNTHICKVNTIFDEWV